MIIIKNSCYSLQDLENTCKKPLSKDTLEDWEYNFWYFIQQWFNAETKTIEIHTSGSTGVPKMIKHSKEFMIASAKMTCTFFNLNQNQTALLCLPTNSVGGIMMIVRSFVSGMNLIIQKPSSNPLKEIDTKIDFVAMVPMQVQKSLTDSFVKWSLVKTVIIGGGKVSSQLEKELIQNKITAFSTFGMTETISHIALKEIGGMTEFKALPNCFFSLNENNCLKIDAKEIGVNRLQTNDVVNLLSPTEFEWLGRLDNAIETGGIKVLPEKIEEKLTHLFTTRFFISSLSDKLLNNKLILLIEGTESDFSLAVLNEFLSLYERPKEYYFIDKFEETKTGKFSRKLTKEKFIHNN